MKDRLEAKKPIPLWLAEPKRHEFEYKGFPVKMLRHDELMTWCGYAGIKKDHELYGVHYDSVDLEVHGGLTFSGEHNDSNLWWLGFDCAHGGDLTPGTYYLMLKIHMEPLIKKGATKREAYDIARNHPTVKIFSNDILTGCANVYRDMNYVIEHCKGLIDQIESGDYGIIS